MGTRGLGHALVALAPMIATASCVLVTGSTDGYELAVDAAAPPTVEAGPGLDIACLSTNDCASDGGAGVCCVTASSSTSARAACQGAPCGGALPIQLCTEGAECGGLTCILQTCTLAGAAVAVRACGTIPTCTPR